MEALNFNITVRKIKEKNHKVAGGLELSTDLDKELRYLKGTVVSVGVKVQKEMEDQPIQILKGDTIFYDRHAGHEIRWTDDEPLLILKLGDLVAIEK